MSVDWRNRFGRNWITSVRNQGGTSNCWAFATTALYEAMVRIEHCLWSSRSEGDMVKGVGKQAWDLGNIGEGITFVEKNGLADPDCFPFGDAAALYTAQESNQTVTLLSPTPDRVGRTVRVPVGSSTSLTDPAQKRQWIDQVGPMATMVTPPVDFGSLGKQVYIPTTTVLGGVHALLVVGYDDAGQYWIVKNSWGTGWGDGGFGKVSYTANLLEPASFAGMRGTNADPWCRRRLRTGALIQGGNGGARNNFELFVRRGMNIEHWYRDNANAALPWVLVGNVRSADPWRDTFHDDALDGAAAVQSTFNRNFEVIYRSNYNSLRHVFFNQASGWWEDGTLFGPANPIGIPGFIQSNRGAPGDFEVVAVDNSGLAHHWTKHNSFPWTMAPGTWFDQGVIAQGVIFSGPGLVQSKLGTTGVPENGSGELHYVCTQTDGQMHHYHRSSSGWNPVTTFGAGVDSAPCVIEGTYGAGDERSVGNFELAVAVGGTIEHWWRFNAVPGPWNRSAVFGSGARRVIGLIQSTFGTNLEIIVENQTGTYQHYWRDGAGWHAGVTI
jgi:Papain family cysteine protease